MNNKKSSRKIYLDNIKWITVVIVVIYHVIFMYNSKGIGGVAGNITGLKVQYYDAYQYFVYPWFMFLLFLVSGITSRSYLETHSNKEFIKSRTVKCLVPATVGLFVFQFIQGYYNAGLGGGLESLKEMPLPVMYLILALSGIGVLWYIQVLWVLSLILVLIRLIEKDRLWNLGKKTGIIAMLLMTALVFGGAQILNTPVISVYRFGYYGVAFFLGYFVFSHEEVIERLKKWFIPLLVVALAIGVAFCIMFFGQNYPDAPVNRHILFTSYGWFASLAFLSGGAKYLNRTNAFASWMSAHSFHLYVFHYLGITLIAYYLAKTGLIPAWASYLLSLVAAFVLAYALGAVISRIPVLRWAVLGVSKKKNKKEKADVKG